MNPVQLDAHPEMHIARSERLGLLVAGVLVLAWVGLIAVVVVTTLYSDHAVANAVTVPLSALSAVVFVLLGVFSTMLVHDRRIQELTRQAGVLEHRVREREEDALRGRALAATLQAQAIGAEGARGPLADHARLSRALFGDLLGHDPAISGETIDDDDRQP